MENNRPLGWTTLEEAKRLVNAGLDPNTADMCYCYDYDKSDFEITIVEFANVIIPRYSYNNSVYERKIPCWSLGALIELMPKEIRLNYLYTLNIFTTYGNKHCVSYQSICEHIYAESEPTLIESVVRCVFWLLENNHIKKHE